MGGQGGEGTNPEQLFAAGYSACFMGALKFVAGQDKAEALVEKAHIVCPYSNAIRGNIQVTLTLL